MINNKKADSILESNVSYIVLLMLFLIPAAIFVWNQMNGASIWSDFYAKELTKIINLAEPGDSYIIDAQRATKIAIGNEVKKEEIFTFDNLKNKVCIKLSREKQSCYNYFNDVDVINYKLETGVPGNILILKIAEAAK